MPPAYPTDVDQTPDTFQNVCSAPQKQPSPKTATAIPAGASVSIGLPSTRCVPPTLNGRMSRPGSAVSALWSSDFERLKIIGSTSRVKTCLLYTSDAADDLT